MAVSSTFKYCFFLVWMLWVSNSSVFASKKTCGSQKVASRGEKIFLHIDRGSYSAGDVIWFKAYMIYNEPGENGVLSSTLFVDVIDSLGSKVDLSIVRIEGCVAAGQLDLPSSIQTGHYSVRAYTEWMSIYKSEDIFVQPIVVEKKNYMKGTFTDDHIRFENFDDEQLEVVMDKTIFAPRERVALNVASTGNFSSSISVTDITFDDDSSYLDYGRSFSLNFDLRNPDTGSFSVRDGVQNEVIFSGDGQLANEVNATFVHFATGEVSIEKIGTNRRAQVSVNFTDSSAVLVHSEALDGLGVARASIVVPENNKRAKPLQKVSLGARSRVERVDTARFVLLDDVTIRAKRTPPPSAPISVDYSFSGEKLSQLKKGNNVLFFLTRIPGVQVESNEEGQFKIIYRSPPFFSPVSLFINGVLSQPSDLFSLNGADVDKIDAFKSLGRITVSIETSRKQRNRNFQIIKMRGFDLAREFPSVNHSGVSEPFLDDRRTLYWNSDVSLTPRTQTFNFFACDLPGRYKIRIVGISSNGILTTTTAYFQIE